LSNSDELIPIYEGSNVTEAHFVKNLLIDEGIDAKVTEEDVPLPLPIMPSHVLIFRRDEDRARAIIDKYDRSSAPAVPIGSAKSAAQPSSAPSTNAMPAERTDRERKKKIKFSLVSGRGCHAHAPGACACVAPRAAHEHAHPLGEHGTQPAGKWFVSLPLGVRFVFTS